MLDTARNTLANWENDTRLPDISSVRQLAIVLNIPLYELLGINNDSIPNAQESIMLDEFRQLSEVNQIVAAHMIHTMLEQESVARDKMLKKRFMILPLQTTKAAAGTGCIDNETPPTPFFVTKNRDSQIADTVVQVSGDSMEPKYHDGDYVYLQYADAADEDDDVVVVFNGGFVIKNYRNHRLYSINKARDFGKNHEHDSFYMVGKVIGLVEQDEIPDKDDSIVLNELFARELKKFFKDNNCE